MSGLRKDARELIESARHEVVPSQAARQRVRAALAAKVGSAALLTTTGASGAGSALLGGTLMKLGVTALVLSSGAFGIRHFILPREMPSIAVPAQRSSQTLAPFGSLPAPQAVAIAPAPRSGGEDEPLHAKEANRDEAKSTSSSLNEQASLLALPSALGAVPPGNSSPPAAAVAPRHAPMDRRLAPHARAITPALKTTLAAETELVRLAHQERVAGRTPSAIAALDQYRAQFPRGILRNEAAAERILALCEVGRIAEARALGSSLAIRGTTVQAIVENSCARTEPRITGTR